MRTKSLSVQVIAERKSRPSKGKPSAAMDSSLGSGKRARPGDGGDGQAVVKRRKLESGERVSICCSGTLCQGCRYAPHIKHTGDGVSCCDGRVRCQSRPCGIHTIVLLALLRSFVPRNGGVEQQ